MRKIICPIYIYLLCLLHITNCAAQDQKKADDNGLDADSVLIENLVRFSKVQSGKAETRIDFILKVSNLSKKPIPDLGVGNRMEQVHFFINEKEIFLPGLGNGREAIAGEKIIGPGKSQTFQQGWALSAGNGLQQEYGNLFTVQWTYNGLQSPLVKVDLYLQKATIVYPVEAYPVDSIIFKMPVQYTGIKTVAGLLDKLNSWSKAEMNAYQHPDQYPDYLVSGETNGFLESCNKALTALRLRLLWDEDRLLYSVAPQTIDLAAAMQLVADLETVFATNKGRDYAGWNTVYYFIDTIRVRSISLLGRKQDEPENEDTATFRKKLLEEPFAQSVQIAYSGDTITTHIFYNYSRHCFAESVTRMYNTKGCLLYTRKAGGGPGWNTITTTKNTFDDLHRVIRIRTTIKKYNEAAITKYAAITYGKNIVLVKNKYGTIRALFSKE